MINDPDYQHDLQLEQAYEEQFEEEQDDTFAGVDEIMEENR